MGQKKVLKKDFADSKVKALKGARILATYSDIPDANSLAHLLTEVNALMCDHLALIKILANNKVINEISYLHNRKKEMEQLVKTLEARLSEKKGSPVVL